jgi:hypothetical protein
VRLQSFAFFTRTIWRFGEGFPSAKIGWRFFVAVIIPIILIFVLVLAAFVVTGRPGILLAGV